MYLAENLHANSFEPTEQFSINFESRFTLTKVFKLRSEVKKKCSTVNTVTKNSYNFTSINCTLLKFYMQIISNLLNNFQLIFKVDLLWPKCSNYALKLKKKCSAVNTVTKNSYNFMTI